METKEQQDDNRAVSLDPTVEATLLAIDAGAAKPAADQWHRSKAGNQTIKVGDRLWTVKKSKRGFYWMMHYQQDKPVFPKSSFDTEAGAVESANESIGRYEFGPDGV